MQEITGEQFVRSLASHVRENGPAIAASARAIVAALDEHSWAEPSADDSNRPESGRSDYEQKVADLSHHTIANALAAIPLGSVLASGASLFGGSGAKTSKPVPPAVDLAHRSTFTMDPYHLAYLNTLFAESSLVQSHLLGGDSVNGLEKPPVSAVPDSNLEQSTASYFTFLWPSNANTAVTPPTSHDEDVFYLYHFFKSLSVLRIAPVRRNQIIGFEPKDAEFVTVKYLRALVYLQLEAVHPRVISGWHAIRDQLRSLSCRYSLTDANELVTSIREDLQREQGRAIVRDGTQHEEDVPTYLPSLTHLNLSGNSLTDLAATLISHFPRCTHLNLSSNALTTVPPGLSLLADLTYADLSGNRITSLSGAEDPLRNVETLLLKANALENLLGVETLARLRAIDVSENKIWDVYEVGRLASLTSVNDIKVAENPLTKLPNFRTNCFTYFKARAMHLSLDGSLPTPTERKIIHANLTVSASPSTNSLASHARLSGRKPRSARSRDGTSADGKSVSSKGTRSVTSEAKSGKAKRGKKRSEHSHQDSASATSRRGSIVTMPTVPEHQMQGSLVAHVSTDAPVGSESHSDSTQIQRLHRLVEIEKTVEGSRLQATDDFVVSRTAKKVPKAKPKVRRKKEKLKAENITPASEAGVAEPGRNLGPPTADMLSCSFDDRDSWKTPASSLHSPIANSDPLETPGSIPPRSPKSLNEPVDEDTRIPQALPQVTSESSLKVRIPEVALPVPVIAREPMRRPPPPPAQLFAPSLTGTHIKHIGPYRRIFDHPATDAATSTGTSSTGVRWQSTNDAPDQHTMRMATGASSARPQRRSLTSQVQAGGPEDFTPITINNSENHTMAPTSDPIISPLPSLWFGKRAGETKKSPSPTSSPPPVILARPLRSTGPGSLSTSSVSRSFATAPAYMRSTGDARSIVSSRLTFASMPAWMIPEANNREREVPSAPTLPFLWLTNSLKLYLSLNVMRQDEKPLRWLPVSLVIQIGDSMVGSRKGFGLLNRNSNSESSLPPAQRPGYMLLTNERLCIFEPKFKFPFVGNSSKDIEGTRYDEDVTALLRLIRSVRLSSLKRIDVGPNDQYFVVRYFIKNDRRDPSAGSGFHALSAGGMAPATPVRTGQGGSWENVVAITRDKQVTTDFLSALELEIGGTRASQLEGQMANLWLNRDTSWAVREITDHVLLKKGSKSHVGFPSTWLSLSRKDGTAVGRQWFERLFTGNWAESSHSQPTVTRRDPRHILVASMLTAEDEDLSITGRESLRHELKTYLHVGFLITEQPSMHSPKGGMAVRACSLAVTNRYLYLFQERLDVWPPRIFPAEQHVPSWVNEAASFNDEDTVNAKGLIVDAVQMASKIVDVGQVQHICRCERWRAWRWNGLAGGEGGVVQNGYIGLWRSGKSRGSERNKEWAAGPEGQFVEGNSAGWSWWVRVTFRLPNSAQPPDDTGPDSTSDTPTATPNRPPIGATSPAPDERHWDLAFVSLGSANEFLRALQALRGVRQADTNFAAEENTSVQIELGNVEEDYTEQASTFSREDGIDFVVGDD
ncbi:hypothetical protein BC832DRAFT_470555 [Gaertneriomyces semiglobifer]|nr:hypothetical protein BC832DRAFT_470555 [Gaertneriomyces semiglobifer]